MNITQEQFKLMVESICSDLIEYLVGTENYSLKEAVDIVYGSDTYAALARPTTGLYNQSTGYVLEYFKREIKTGKMS